MKSVVVLVVALVFCLFMGIMAVSLGLGAVVPSLNRIAKPLVCPNGEMIHQTNTSNPMPGRTYVQASWTCVSPSGSAAPINNFLLAVYAGSFYGVLMFMGFLVLFGLRKLLGRSQPQRVPGPPH